MIINDVHFIFKGAVGPAGEDGALGAKGATVIKTVYSLIQILFLAHFILLSI